MVAYLHVRRQRFREKVQPDDYVLLAWEYLERFIPETVIKGLMEDLTGPNKLFDDRKTHFFNREDPSRNRARTYRLAGRFRVYDWSSDVVKYVCRDHQVRCRFKTHRSDKAYEASQTHPAVAEALGRWVDRAEVAPGPCEEADWPYHALLAKQPWKTFCRQGRYHTPFTALRKELRGRVTLKGEPLISVDIKNSQPLLLGVTLKRFMTEGGLTNTNNNIGVTQ